MGTFYNSVISVLVLAFITWGCDSSSVMSTNKISAIDNDGVSRSGSLRITVGEQITEDIIFALQKDNGITDTQAETIRSGALVGLSSTSSNASTGLSLQDTATTIDQDDTTQVAPIVLKGAIASLASADAAVTEDASKIKVVGTMTKALFSSLNDKLSSTDASKKSALPGAIAQAAVGALDDSGLSASAMSEGVGALVEQTVANLDEAGFKPEELSSVVQNVTASSVAGLKEAGVKSSSAGPILKNLMAKSIAALGSSGAKKEDFGSIVGPMIKNAVSKLDDIGMQATQVVNVVDDMMAGAVGSLDDSGLSGANEFKEVLDDCIVGAMDAMEEAGLGGQHFASAMENMMSGAMSSLDDIGLKSASDLGAVSEIMVQKAISHVDSFKSVDASIVQKASAGVLVGMTKAMVDFKSGGIIDNSAFSQINSKVQKSSVNALKEHQNKFQLTGLESIVNEGMLDGMLEGGMNGNDITASMSFAGNSVVTDFLSRMQSQCLAEHGVWDPNNGGSCTFPKQAPVAGGSQPTAAEEDKCINGGGVILFLADGSWFCNGVAVANKADCDAKGYFWGFSPDGNLECSSIAPISACSLKIDRDHCSRDGCVWHDNVCKEGKLVECFQMSTANECSSVSSCSWDTDVCRNAVIVAEATATAPAPAPSVSEASNLHWTGATDPNTGSLVAAWDPAASSDLNMQYIQFFTDGHCGSFFGPEYQMAASVNQYNITGTAGNAYSFRIRSESTSGATSLSPCSPSYAVTGGGNNSNTTTESLPSSVTVEPVYPNHGANWMDWVKFNTTTQQHEDIACDNTQANCQHGGEMRKVVVTGVSSCNGLTITDDRAAFAWECRIENGVATFFSTHMQKNLEDLINTYGNDWHSTWVTITDSNSDTTASTPAKWFSNPLHAVTSSECGTNFTKTSGTIYTFTVNEFASTASCAGQEVNSTEKVGFVIYKNVEFVPTSNSCMDGVQRCSLGFMSNSHFGYIEGSMKPVTYTKEGFFVKNSSYILGQSLHIDGSASYGLELDNSFFNEFYGGEVKNTNNDAIRLINSDYNFFYKMQVSASNVNGISLNNSSDPDGSANNTFIEIQVSGSMSRGLNITSSDDNTFVDSMFTDNGAEGILLSGSSSNSFHQVRSTTNYGDGLYATGNSHELIVANSLFAMNGNMSGHGVKINSSNSAVLKDLTIANNKGSGIYLYGSDYSRVINSVIYNNSSNGLHLDTTSDQNEFRDLVFAYNQTQHIDIQGNSNTFLGEVKLHTAGCTIGGSGNNMDSSCAPVSSGFSYTTAFAISGIPFANHPASEATNYHAVNNRTKSTISDWTNFDTKWRTWGVDYGTDLNHTSVFGQCTSGSCFLWDYSLPSGSEFLNAHNCPNGIAKSAYTLNSTSVDFALYAQEKTDLSAHGGNRNGLCEAGETCIPSPHYGAYQGHGEASSPHNTCGNIGSGGGILVPNINIFGYSNSSY